MDTIPQSMNNLNNDILNIIVNDVNDVNEYVVVLSFACKWLHKYINSTSQYNCLSPRGPTKTFYIIKTLKAFCYDGHTNLLEWFQSTFITPKRILRHMDFITKAVEGGHIHTVEFLLHKNPGNSDYACIIASHHGQGSILKWIIDAGYSCNVLSCANAAAYRGDLEIIQYCETKVRTFDFSTVCTSAVTGNQLATLTWLWENDYPISSEASSEAAKHNNLPILKFLLEADCEWDDRVVLYKRKHRDVIEWLDQEGYDYNHEKNSSSEDYDDEKNPSSED